jgi:hypothetical protein
MGKREELCGRTIVSMAKRGRKNLGVKTKRGSPRKSPLREMM